MAGFNQALNGGMNIVAPPIGALLLGLLPLQGVLALEDRLASPSVVVSETASVPG